MKDEKYMRRAIELARRGEGFVNPNPLVGCVVVKDDRIITEGWHEVCGGFHAERNALSRCTEDVTGAELYVTLEPCCHTGKTPPCTDIIIEKKIGTVYVGSDDPNPLVAGHGIELLRDAGITVETHVLKDECDALNEIFFHYITTGLPFVAMKYAMTLDGKITLGGTGLSLDIGADRTTDNNSSSNDYRRCLPAEERQITGVEARNHVHSLRRRYASILVGIGTVLADDPMLNVRDATSVDGREDRLDTDVPDWNGKLSDYHGIHPIRVILDSSLRIPMDSKVVATAGEIPTIIAYVNPTAQTHDFSSTSDISKNHVSTKVDQLRDAGVILWELPTGTSISKPARVDISALLKRMSEEGIDSVLVEGGSTVHGAFFERRNYVNRVYAYLAPKLIGGTAALSPVGGPGVTHMSEALHLQDVELLPLGSDILITGKC